MYHAGLVGASTGKTRCGSHIPNWKVERSYHNCPCDVRWWANYKAIDWKRPGLQLICRRNLRSLHVAPCLRLVQPRVNAMGLNGSRYMALLPRKCKRFRPTVHINTFLAHLQCFPCFTTHSIILRSRLNVCAVPCTHLFCLHINLNEEWESIRRCFYR